MTKEQNSPWKPSKPDKLAKQFSRYGWIGFWLQVVMVSISLIILIYVRLIGGADIPLRKAIDLGDTISMGNLVLVIFTTYWFYRYTRVGMRIADPQRRPAQKSVVRMLWIGLGAGYTSILLSMVLMMGEARHFLMILLTMPQTDIQFSMAGGSNPEAALSAIDAANLKFLLLSHSVELVALAFSLWLLYQVTHNKSDEKTLSPSE